MPLAMDKTSVQGINNKIPFILKITHTHTHTHTHDTAMTCDRKYMKVDLKQLRISVTSIMSFY